MPFTARFAGECTKKLWCCADRPFSPHRAPVMDAISTLAARQLSRWSRRRANGSINLELAVKMTVNRNRTSPNQRINNGLRVQEMIEWE